MAWLVNAFGPAGQLVVAGEDLVELFALVR